MKKLVLIVVGFVVSATVLFSADLKTYQATYDKQMESIILEHGATISKLNESYSKALNTLSERATGAGDLNKTRAVMAEIERFAKEKTVASDNAKDSSPDLKKIQLSYLQNSQNLEASKARKILYLVSKFDSALGKLQVSLTKSRKLDDALAVQNVREALVASEDVVGAKTCLEQKTRTIVESGDTKLPESQVRNKIFGKKDGIASKPSHRGKFKPSTRGQILSLTFENGVTDKHKKPPLEYSNLKTTLAGKYGKGCEFKGNGRIGLGPVAIPKSGTLCVWVRISPDADLAKEMRVLDGNGICFQFIGGKMQGHFNDGEGARVGIADVPVGEWTHLAMTWGNNYRRYYVNGILHSELGYSGKPYASSRKVYIGSRWTGNEAFFKGEMDDFFMYERCLEAKEVAQVAAVEVE